MTTQIANPSSRVAPKAAAVGAVTLVLAVAAGLLVGALDDPVPPVAPGVDVSRNDPVSGARDSWEGRIGPAANGVRDSWMPPGTTDRDLVGLERRR